MTRTNGLATTMRAEGAQASPYDARAVANLLLELAEEQRKDITQMQLLKMLYFASGWYLVSESKPLIRQDFQAWEFGPVVKVVRDAFKDFGKDAIKGRAGRLNIFTGELEPVDPIVDLKDIDFIRSIFSTYSSYGGWKLSDMTHVEGSPWDQVWNSSKPVGRLGLKINNESIREHFLELSRQQRLN